jgi:hypothetical protein
LASFWRFTREEPDSTLWDTHARVNKCLHKLFDWRLLPIESSFDTTEEMGTLKSKTYCVKDVVTVEDAESEVLIRKLWSSLQQQKNHLSFVGF